MHADITGFDLYRILRDRYNSNTSESYALGFIVYQDLLIAEVLRRVGISVSRHGCTWTNTGLNNETVTTSLVALEIDGKLFDSKENQGWDEIIKNHKCVWPAMGEEYVSLRTFNDITVEEDHLHIEQLDRTKRTAIMQWIASEQAFIEGWLLSRQAQMASSPSKKIRL